MCILRSSLFWGNVALPGNLPVVVFPGIVTSQPVQSEMYSNLLKLMALRD